MAGVAKALSQLIISIGAELGGAAGARGRP